MKAKTSRQLLTVDETAKQLALKISTIRRRILERKITYIKLGKAVRIPIEEVERIIAKGYRPALDLKTDDFHFLNRSGPK